MEYKNRECNQFVDNMRKAGYVVEPYYCGRLCYEGPAVRCKQSICATVERATSVQLQHHTENDQVVMYPVRNHNSPNPPSHFTVTKKKTARRPLKWTLKPLERPSVGLRVILGSVILHPKATVSKKALNGAQDAEKQKSFS